MRWYLLIVCVMTTACSTVRPINAEAHSGLCNDVGEECCDTPGVCDSSQGLGCNAATHTCVFIENGGTCDDPGEPCCTGGCDPETHLECDATRNVCVLRTLDAAECGDFGEPCCPVTDPDASAESATGCLEGMGCVATAQGGREQTVCLWTGVGQSQVDVGYACLEGICREPDLLCHPTTHSCVIVAGNPGDACASWGAPCCMPDGVCHGVGLQCFHATCMHSAFE